MWASLANPKQPSPEFAHDAHLSLQFAPGTALNANHPLERREPVE